MNESISAAGYPLNDFTKGFLIFFESRVHCLVDVRDYVICDNNSNDIWMYVNDNTFNTFNTFNNNGDENATKGWLLLLKLFLSHAHDLE